MNEAFADFIDSDITRMDNIKWSSISTQTGVGAFSATTANLQLVQTFRKIMRTKVYNGHMAESFPKQTMLAVYGITLYAHGSAIPYRPPVFLAMLLWTYQKEFNGECKALKSEKFPSNHPIIRKQNSRIISLLPDQKFLPAQIPGQFCL